MESTTEESKLLDWLKARPEMYEQLKRIRELESSDPEIDRAELYHLQKGLSLLSVVVTALCRRSRRFRENASTERGGYNLKPF